ncbi:MAG: FAD-dependent oxidoreductase [Deltaproteobacteria bacterium]|nr:FAD-dependent oxidoreductase [Deltaproteobacteria bacterium]
MKVKYLILGAGPTGLGAAYRLKDLGEQDYLLLEKNPWVGGLATSFKDDAGFWWDIGGHVQFSHYKYFDDVMDLSLGKDGWLEHERESWVWIKNRFVPYPFQNNIRYLPKESVWKCLKGIIEITKNPLARKPANFAEWTQSIFGAGIGEEFMNPYNFKVWAYPLTELAYHWIGERVSVVDLNRVLENVILERDDVSWGPNNKFRFPKQGGTGAIWHAVGKMVGADKTRTNCTVTRINAQERSVLLSDGSSVQYEHLLSTMPLDICAGLVSEIPDALKQRAGGLKYSSTNIVGVGLRGQPKPELESKCWMYFPESDCPFYRVTLFSKYSPLNVPDIKTQFSLMTETSESPAKPVNHKTLLEETISGLRNTKLISDKDQIVSTWTFHAPYGYPTPSLERDAIIKDVMPALQKLGVYSRGRFGGWKYEVANQDHSFMQGVEWADYMLKGVEESTFKV